VETRKFRVGPGVIWPQIQQGTESLLGFCHTAEADQGIGLRPETSRGRRAPAGGLSRKPNRLLSTSGTKSFLRLLD